MKQQKKITKQNGITLISLIITIVVMLILAGVAISIIVEPDGLFGKAENATEKWGAKVTEEQTEFDKVLGWLPGGLPDGWNPDVVAEVISQSSTVAGVTKERNVPIPKGFTVSKIDATINPDSPEDKIEKGLVIYKIPEGAEVNWETSKIKLTPTSEEKILQNEVDQYVWIPVDDINQMVMCKKNNEKGTTTSLNEADLCNVDLVENVLQCKTHDSDDLCGRLYGTVTDTSITPFRTNMNFADRAQKWETSAFCEPFSSGPDTSYSDVVGGYEVLVASLTDDFKAMATSIKKYGGFYVGRYEAGVGGASKKGQVVVTASSSDGTVYKGLNMWYGLYKEIRKDVTDKEVNGTVVLKSHMIYGSQYDQIINFIGEEAQKGHPGKVVTSQSVSGTLDTDKLNNIYDLEGNNFEWTAETAQNYSRVTRGDHYSQTGLGVSGYYPASNRYAYSNLPISNTIDYASRVALYVAP